MTALLQPVCVITYVTAEKYEMASHMLLKWNATTRIKRQHRLTFSIHGRIT
jgi:hypothetical protein